MAPRITTFDAAVAKFREVSEKYSEVGATDTEPRGVFADIIEAMAVGKEPRIPQKHSSGFFSFSEPTWQLFSDHPKHYFASREMTRAAERVVRLGTAADAQGLCDREGWYYSPTGAW